MTNLNELFGIAGVMEAARSTGLLAALAAGGGTAEQLASRLGVDARALPRTLDVLAAFDLATVDAAGTWRTSQAMAEWIERMPGGLGALDLWAHATPFLQTGSPFMHNDGSADVRAQGYKDIVPRLAMMFAAAADELATRVPLQPRRILDVGCGSGVWSLAIAAKHQDAHVVGLDLPFVIEAFQARAASLGLAARTGTLVGDVHTMELPPRAYDLVVVANVLRIETAERAQAIVARVAPSVADGGALLIIDALGGDGAEAKRALSLYAFHLAMRTAQGGVHPAARIRGWLAEQGFTAVTPLPLHHSDGSHGALLARRGLG